MFFSEAAVKAGVVPKELYVIAVGAGPRAFIINGAWLTNLWATFMYVIGAAVVQPGREDDKEWTMANLRLDDRHVSYSIKEQVALAIQQGVPIESIVVCICTPTGLHCQHICEAIEAGVKHILCDKPLVTSVAELRKIQAALAKTKGVQIYLTFNHRYNGAVFQMRAIAAKNPGNVARIDAAFLQDWLHDPVTGQQADWRVANELCGKLDIETHAVDLVSFVAGSPVASVKNAVIARKGPFAIERGFSDQGHTDLMFANGIVGSSEYDQGNKGHADDIYVIMTLKGGEQYLWRMAWGPETLFVGSTMSSVDNPSEWEMHLRGHSPLFATEINEAFGATPGGHIQGWPSYWRSLFLAIAGDIYRRNGNPIVPFLPTSMQLPVPTIGDAGVNITAFIEASVLSARSGGASVPLAEVLGT